MDHPIRLKNSATGEKTAFVPRPKEYGPGQTTNLEPESDWDFVANSMTQLAERLR